MERLQQETRTELIQGRLRTLQRKISIERAMIPGTRTFRESVLSFGDQEIEAAVSMPGPLQPVPRAA